MALEYRFTCPLPNGLHARPATALAQVVQRGQAEVRLTNLRSGASANTASVLDIIAAGVLHSDPCVLHISGEQEADAFERVRSFIEHELPGCDVTLPPETVAGRGELPRALRGRVEEWHAGIPLTPGELASGKIYPAALLRQRERRNARAPGSPAEELRRLDKALADAAETLKYQAKYAQNNVQFDILETTRAMLCDTQVRAAMLGGVEAGVAAEAAVRSGVEVLKARLAGSESEYLRQRQADMEGIGWQVLGALQRESANLELIRLGAESILCAASLTPAELLSIDMSTLRGLVLGEAGANSHTVILARARGKPVLGGVAAAEQLPQGTSAILDAVNGVLLISPSAEARRYYTREQEAQQANSMRRFHATRLPGQTADGKTIEVCLNAESSPQGPLAPEALSALASRIVDGIGLYRTETLYAARDEPPAESEQAVLYQRLASFHRPVVIRTFDIGGDKPLPYLNLPAEVNPFLGQRGLRLYAGHLPLLRSQLRAICRASVLGTLKVMAPMVSTPGEARWFREQVRAAQAELEAEGLPFDPKLPVGAMLEVPAAAFAIEQLSAHCDFFSLGTNDLCQYFFAADRGNPGVAALNNVRQPAFLRLLLHSVDEAKRCGRRIGMCGEMAGDVRNAPLLAGLGLDELSMAPLSVGAMKAALFRLDSQACRALLEQAAACATVEQVEELLDSFPASQPHLGARPGLPLLERGLIVQHSDAASQAEVLRELARLLYANGRTDDLDAVEEALWARERMSSTGLGHGFAIPHCKTDKLHAGTLAVLKLSKPVEWHSLDGAPVSFVLLLAMRESGAENEQLQVFAKLARKLMDAGFRKALRSAREPNEIDAILALLQRELELE